MTKVMWQPSSFEIDQSQMQAFLNYVNAQQAMSLSSYKALWQWSTQEFKAFWRLVWSYFGIKASKQPEHIYQQLGDAFYDVKWFEAAKLNYAENLLQAEDAVKALTFISEQGEVQALTFGQLKKQVANFANRLKAFGVTAGDRVAACMPNCIETVVGMLATTSIGAVWSSCSPDFGAQGLCDRFDQIKPKVLMVCDGYHYNGTQHDCMQKNLELINKLDSLEAVVMSPFLNQVVEISHMPNAHLYDDFLSGNDDLSFEQMAFDAPLFILFSSGTTGRAKCIVHSVGGTLLQHLKELSLHSNLSKQDSLFFFTTCGWMMWNWQISALALGTHIVLYDGCPSFPTADRLIRIVDEHNVSVFGCGAKYLDAIEKADCQPKQKYELADLKVILTTGSPLSPHSFDYVYQSIKARLQLSSISGGTDILSCFALGAPNLPVYRGELQCRGLGMDVDVYDADGKAVQGVKGELVCKTPFPSMPIYFWADQDKQKYHKAYFSRFEKVWAHGDYAELTSSGGMVIYGRSDAVLNPGGVRIGTAEIYRQVEKVPQVLDSVVVGQPWQGDERVVLFVQLKYDIVLDDKLIKDIKQLIRTNTTPRHVPQKVVQVKAIPRTMSGKVVEVAVKKIISYQVIDNLEAIANPESLNDFKNRVELET